MGFDPRRSGLPLRGSGLGARDQSWMAADLFILFCSHLPQDRLAFHAYLEADSRMIFRGIYYIPTNWAALLYSYILAISL